MLDSPRHRDFAIERDLACLPGACRGAIYEDKTIICEMRAIASLVEIDHPRRLGVVYVIEQQRLSVAPGGKLLPWYWMALVDRWPMCRPADG
jgi:hypothetical protein